MAAPTVLKINGVAMPTPSVGGITFTQEPIWSDDAGRDSTGKAVGTIKCYKWKMQVKWPPLTFADAAKVFANCSKGSRDFKSVAFFNPLTQATETITAYCGTASMELYTTTGPKPVRGVAVDIIEQ